MAKTDITGNAGILSTESFQDEAVESKISPDVKNQAKIKKDTPDATTTVGDNNIWQVLTKYISADGKITRSTKAMEILRAGCVVQVTTKEGDMIAESLCFVPGVRITPDENNGKKLIAV